ncbi:hypothetical protein HHI36_006836 [Cryptolaemus montrouzieri]|uniref:Uncharacterized protein n=1 Tax=Cryptolaemus montrouzieri TaxID=559131 RepID=A0ABD2MMZ1_9CUCU
MIVPRGGGKAPTETWEGASFNTGPVREDLQNTKVVVWVSEALACTADTEKSCHVLKHKRWDEVSTSALVKTLSTEDIGSALIQGLWVHKGKVVSLRRTEDLITIRMKIQEGDVLKKVTIATETSEFPPDEVERLVTYCRHSNLQILIGDDANSPSHGMGQHQHDQ